MISEQKTPQNLGLTEAEVQERVQQGQTNYTERTTSRPLSQILRANIFTVFNGILTVATIVVIAVGDWRDAVFATVMIANALIGVVSELRAKRTLDSIAVLETPLSVVTRAGKQQTIPSSDIVLGDLVNLKLGDQVPADGVILDASGLEIDESVLTGESFPVEKKAGDSVLSGTTVVAGTGTFVANAVGAQAWAQKITAEAKKFTLVTSEIQTAINKILKWITWSLPVVVALLLWSQLRVDGDWRIAVVLAVAGVVGMIPQGLVLLTSMNFGIAAAQLAHKGVLVQELPAVEVLARTDILCLDKTGTLTTGQIRGETLQNVSEVDSSLVNAVLLRLTDDQTNATASAIMGLTNSDENTRHGIAELDEAQTQLVAFNSLRKWSALRVSSGVGQGTWVLGAPEILRQEETSHNEAANVDRVVSSYTEQGKRVVVLMHSTHIADEKTSLPAGLQTVCVIILSETVRPDAETTLRYFKDQAVEIKIISGDSAQTVGAIASQVQLKPAGELVAVDARTLPPVGSDQFATEVGKVDVFGRVTPEQKRGIVQALQGQGHTVAMTGDGVNDALALKEADLGIAMGSGASATKAVSKLVLMNDHFSVLPDALASGRRVIANMERVASLFLSKTTYALFIAVVVSVAGWAYPFLPRHLTYIGWFTIGIPAFFLALAPNNRRYKPGFLERVLLLAVPAGLIMALSALVAYAVVGPGSIDGHTVATLTMILVGLELLAVTARPLVPWRLGLLVAMAIGASVGVLIPVVRHFFALAWPSTSMWLIVLCCGFAGAILLELYYRFFYRPGQIERPRQVRDQKVQ